MRAIPKTYAGTTFASTLEADWVLNLDGFRMAWEYEPEGVVLDDGTYYRPDLYLPLLTTWVEVKGPHNERIDKPGKLQLACLHAPGCAKVPCDCGYGIAFPWRLVVVARPGVRGRLNFHAPAAPGLPDGHLVIAHCGVCQQYSFADLNQTWKCRRCHQSGDVAVYEPSDVVWRTIAHHPSSRKRVRR